MLAAAPDSFTTLANDCAAIPGMKHGGRLRQDHRAVRRQAQQQRLAEVPEPQRKPAPSRQSCTMLMYSSGEKIALTLALGDSV